MHRLPVRVYYEDTDAGGVVYYANYLKFAERARTEYLRALGFSQTELAERQGVLFAVRRAALDLRRPARLDDALTVTTRVTVLSGARINMMQSIDKEDEIIAILEIELACIRPDFTPARLPEEVRRHLLPGEDG